MPRVPPQPQRLRSFPSTGSLTTDADGAQAGSSTALMMGKGSEGGAGGGGGIRATQGVSSTQRSGGLVRSFYWPPCGGVYRRVQGACLLYVPLGSKNLVDGAPSCEQALREMPGPFRGHDSEISARCTPALLLRLLCYCSYCCRAPNAEERRRAPSPSLDVIGGLSSSATRPPFPERIASVDVAAGAARLTLRVCRVSTKKNKNLVKKRGGGTVGSRTCARAPPNAYV